MRVIEPSRALRAPVCRASSVWSPCPASPEGGKEKSGARGGGAAARQPILELPLTREASERGEEGGGERGRWRRRLPKPAFATLDDAVVQSASQTLTPTADGYAGSEPLPPRGLPASGQCS